MTEWKKECVLKERESEGKETKEVVSVKEKTGRVFSSFAVCC